MEDFDYRSILVDSGSNVHCSIAHNEVLIFTVLILIIMTIIIVSSGAMWALGLVVLLVTVAGVLALLVYVLKW